MNVLLTVDTELSPSRGVATESQLRDNIRGSFHGCPNGKGGLPFQLQQLNDHDLNAVFFIEALSSIATGQQPLQDIVSLVNSARQEIQLHIHTEWLAQACRNPLGTKTGQNMHEFSASEQTELIRLAKAALLECGVREVNAFRAGNYGANNDTLKALARNSIRYDSSYNYPYLGDTCHIQTPHALKQPKQIESVREIPVTFFADRPGHLRHTQLCACSFGELSHMLMEAHAAGYPTFVIVSHSFELLSRSRKNVNKTLTSRFAKLCRFLAKRRDLFQTVGFNELHVPETDTVAPLTSSIYRTVGRYGEQLVGKIYE